MEMLYCTLWMEPERVRVSPYFVRETLIKAMPPETPYIQLSAGIIFGSMLQAGLGTFINPRYEPQVRVSSREIKLMLEGCFDEIVGSNT